MKNPNDAPGVLSDLWLFGYGSLIWNPGFTYRESREATLSNWTLRFWQASLDHRGTPSFPGRVATIVPRPGEQVMGRAYKIEGPQEEILRYLDHREKGGYSRLPFQVSTPQGDLDVFCYVGLESSPQFIGPEKEEETARIISVSAGPSGRNRDYLMNLHQVLQKLGAPNDHLQLLVDRLTPEH